MVRTPPLRFVSSTGFVLFCILSYLTCMPARGAIAVTTPSQLTNKTVFAGKDASRALATSSLKPEDVNPEYSDLGDKEQGVLNDWFTFFSKRYNIVGKVAGSASL
jgi:hypothetical protein